MLLHTDSDHCAAVTTVYETDLINRTALVRDPYARWCGRGEVVRPLTIPIGPHKGTNGNTWIEDCPRGERGSSHCAIRDPRWPEMFEQERFHFGSPKRGSFQTEGIIEPISSLDSQGLLPALSLALS
jgi:hypothetical protein